MQGTLSAEVVLSQCFDEKTKTLEFERYNMKKLTQESVMKHPKLDLLILPFMLLVIEFSDTLGLCQNRWHLSLNLGSQAWTPTLDNSFPVDQLMYMNIHVN